MPPCSQPVRWFESIAGRLVVEVTKTGIEVYPKPAGDCTAPAPGVVALRDPNALSPKPASSCLMVPFSIGHNLYIEKRSRTRTRRGDHCSSQHHLCIYRGHSRGSIKLRAFVCLTFGDASKIWPLIFCSRSCSRLGYFLLGAWCSFSGKDIKVGGAKKAIFRSRDPRTTQRYFRRSPTRVPM